MPIETEAGKRVNSLRRASKPDPHLLVHWRAWKLRVLRSERPLILPSRTSGSMLIAVTAPSATPVSNSDRADWLAALSRRYRRALLAYFGRRVPSPAEAEDLTQDVFERLLRSLDNGPIQNAEAFIFRIAVNLLRDRARKLQTHGVEEPIPADTVTELAEALTVDVSPERVVEGERTLEEVLSALNELGERTRAMFYLYRFENLKVREIAELYGITPSGVEKQIARALLHLTRRLQQK